MNIAVLSSIGGETSWRRIEYTQRAAECRALAHEACNDGARQELLALADIWMTLADTRRATA